MNFTSRSLSGFSFGVVSLLLLLVLTALVLLASPDGIERASLLQFVGRFHPLSVHFPIAVLLLVPLFEILGRKRNLPFLLASVDLLLLLGTCGAIAAAALGWCLARGGGYSGPLVRQHMLGGILVAAATWLCWWLRPHAGSSAPARVYAALLLASVGLVSFTGYRGGQLAHGANHLTEFMPSPLHKWLGSAGLVGGTKPVEENPSTFYGARIQPLFEGHCVTCHGQNKHRAGLRLDNYAAAMRGGKHGPVIKPGDLKGSELFHRITLPPTDDDFMPADNKRPLSVGEVKSIEAWISQGASRTLAVGAIAAIPTNSPNHTTAAEVTFPEGDPEAIAREREAFAAILSQVQLRLPNIVEYQSRNSAFVVVNASWRGSKFGDNDVAVLAALSQWIVAADFSGTAITDRSARDIAAMKKLRQLRLAHTAITDSTIQEFASLDQLESLSIFDTRVTESSLSMLARLAKLRNIYAGETKIPHGAAVPAQIKDKLVF
jgi:uncharacterized membrane protein